MDVIASIVSKSSLHFDLPAGEDFYYESGVGNVAVPGHTMTQHARLRVGPEWESIRYVAPLVPVVLYAGAGQLRDPHVKDFAWAEDEDNVWLRFILPIQDASSDYSGDFSYSVAIVGKLPSPLMRPKPGDQMISRRDTDT